MKRWLLRILLLLLLGAVTTVGVAWGLALGMPVDRQWAELEALPHSFERITHNTRLPYRVHYRSAGAWRVVRADSTSLEMLMTRTGHSPQEFSGRCPAWAINAESIGTSEIVLDARGFPLLAMRGIATIDRETIEDYWHFRLIAVIKPDEAPPQLATRVVPLRPILPGFIINTLFYAAIWFGLFFGVAALRRARRKRRGRCVKCGYDLRGQRSAVSDQSEHGDQRAGLTSDRRPLTSGIGCSECGWGRVE